MLTPAGGNLEAAGIRLSLPPKALSAPQLLGLIPGPAEPPALPGLEKLPLLAEFSLDSGGQAFANPLGLSLPLPAGFPRGASALLVRITQLGGRSRYRLVGIARPAGTRLQLVQDQPPVWPGIDRDGHYLMLRYDQPLALVHGRIDRAGQGAPVAVAVDGWPLEDLAEGRDYRLAVPLGPARLQALDLADGAVADLELAPDTRDQLLRRDLKLAPKGPALVASDPPEGSVELGLQPQIRLDFDRALAAEGLSPKTAQLVSGEQHLALVARLSADRRSLYLRPEQALEESRDYRLELGSRAA